MTKRRAALIAVGVLGFTGCSPESVAPEPVRSSDGSDFKYALYVNSNVDNEDLHGSVILVSADGSFQAIKTAGTYNGALARSATLDNAVELLDQSSRIQVTSEGEVRQVPVDEAVVVAPWIGGNESGVTFAALDEGVKDDDYLHTIIGWDGENELKAFSLWGESWGFVSCNGAAYAVVSPWMPGGDGQTFELVEIFATETSVVGTSVRTIAAPPNVVSLEAPICSGDQVVVVGSGRSKGSSLGAFDLVSGESTWQPITHSGANVDIGSPRTVAGDDHVHFIDRQARTVRGVSIATANLDREWDLPTSARGGIYETYAIEQDKMLILVEYDDADPRLLTLSLASGRVLDELVISGLNSYLQNSGEVIIKPPVSFGNR